MSEAARQRILAVDHGERRTGLAATDWTGAIALPLPRLDCSDQDRLVVELQALVRERATQVVVLGMPLHHDGSAGERARRTDAFAVRLRAAISPVPVVCLDESHTTDEAHERLKQAGLKAARRKQLADSIAALVLLERYRAGAR